MLDSIENINVGVSPSLHPRNLEAITGYQAHKGYLSGVHESLELAYGNLSKTHQAREAVAADPTKNAPDRLLTIAAFAERQQDATTRKIDKTLKDLDAGIRATEDMLSAPLRASAAGAGGSMPSEIRKYARALSIGDRQRFLNDALNNGDTQTLVAILSGPPYLAGLSEPERKLRTRAYHEFASPETAERLQVMKEGRALLGERSALLFAEYERAMRATWTDVVEMRARKTKADKAFAATGL